MRGYVDDAYISRYEIQVVGAKQHQELWIPAEALPEFNRHLLGLIQVVAAYYGEEFRAADHQTLLARFPVAVSPAAP